MINVEWIYTCLHLGYVRPITSKIKLTVCQAGFPGFCAYM